MKPKSNPFLSHALAVSLAIAFSATSVFADTYYWDGGTVDIAGVGNAASNPAGNGNWDGTVKNWDQVPSGSAHIAWTNSTADTAEFAGTARTVTVSGTVTAGTLDVKTSSYIFTGGTIDTDFIQLNGTTNQRFDSNLAGDLTITSNVVFVGGLASGTQAIINGDNTGLASTVVDLASDANHITLNHTGAFGSASATLDISTGIVNLGNNAAPNNNVPISYNAWATDLAGTIRGRFSESTWNGAVELTGNSQFMTRNSTGVKLIFSSTGTIDLNDKTLSLWSSSSSAGIELNGVISGTGNLETGGGFGALGGSDNANGTVTLNANNTYTGDTLVNNGTLALSNTGGLKFVIGADDVNNQITGTGTVNLNGLFTFDLTSASTTFNDSWNIVDVGNLTESFGTTFSVDAFNRVGGGTGVGIWTKAIGVTGYRYEFNTVNGMLTVVPEPNAAALIGGFGILALLRRRRH
ncbi:MAG: hypothetical protein RLZZ505_666 [Verrucomicrobiota bacterium]|jgi:autotransporter-associated beta strand protein